MDLEKFQYAVTSSECLTSLGKALSRLPVEIVLGKMLILGSVLLQSETTLSLAAALSVQSPYTNRAHRDIDCEVSIMFMSVLTLLAFSIHFFCF